ncbi:MAG: redox-regulated ATPase YchF [Caldilineales bacterium]
MELGIIGLPNSSKTTIFNALTRGTAPTSSGSSGKLEFNTAVVDVPDKRVDRLSEIFKPRKTVYAKVTYTDIAGLDQGIARKGFSGELRNRIARMDAFVHVVRAFEDESVPHPLTTINPQRDLSILDEEMMLVDLLAIQTRIERIGESMRRAKKGSEEQAALEIEEALMTRLSDWLESGAPLRDMDLGDAELHGIRSFAFLTLKPVLVLVNSGDEAISPDQLVTYQHRHTVLMSLQGKLEMEIAQIDLDEATVFMEEFGITEPALDRMIRASYDLVGLQSFFTVGEDEVRAWTVRKGATAVEAAGAIHSDLARGFIRADVVAYDDLIAAGGSMAEARKAGKARLEGKEYQVQDGEILHVRFAL